MAVNFSGSLLATGSIISTTGFTGSLLGTASYASDANLLDGKDSSIFATTGSNVFIGNQTITGSFLVSGSTTQIGNNTLTGNTILSGSITISGSFPIGSPSASLNIYGNTTHNGYIRFDPVSTNINNSISASYIYVSGSTNDLYFTQNGSGYGNTTRLRWLEGNLYTGLLNGGLITVTTGSTVFNVSSGSGIIVNLNASLSDDPYPTIQYINWGNLISQSLTYLTSSIQTFIGIDSGGNIVQQTDAFNDGQYNTVITIGTVLHQNKSTINASITYPNVAYGYKQRSYDFLKAFGPLKLSGLFINTSSSLGLTVGSGTAFADGRNYQVDPNNPSYITDTGTSVSKIFRYYKSGSAFVQDTNNGAGYTVIDPANYNNNGTLAGVSPSTPWTIQRVFWYPNSATKGIVVYYGNQQYASSTEAISNVPYEPFEEVENTKQNAVYLGAIVIKYNGSFLSPGDYSILTAGLFRGTGGSGGGGGSITSRLVDLSDVAISGPTDGQPLVYNTTAGKWVNQSFISASISGNAVTATSASHATVAISASYFSGSVSNAVSSSYASTASYVQNAQTASFAITASYLLGQSPTASHALTASYVNPLVQNVIITGSLTVGSGSIGASENTLTLGARDAVSEGGQLGFNAPGGTYTSASMLDLYQNRFRLLKGTNAGSTGEVLSANLHSGQIAFTFYQNASSFPGTAVANLAVDSGGNIVTVSPGTVESASYAATASYVLNAVSASRAATSSIASQADQASTVSISGITTDRDFTFPLILTGSSGPSLGLNADLSPGILYNPSSNLFRSTNIIATGSLLGTSSFANNAATASYILNAISSSFAATASSADNLTVRGTLTAQTIVAQTITSSIEFVTGSTRNGSLLTDTHQFTGSVLMTGSLAVTTTGTELQVNAGGVNIGNALTDNHVISGSTIINPNGLFVSSSGNVGIGTTNPTVAVGTGFVVNGRATSPRIALKNDASGDGSTDGFQIVYTTQLEAVLENRELGSIRFLTNGSERMRITSGSNIGIGTVAPSAMLEVVGTSKFGSVITNTHEFTGSVGITGSLLINESNVILTNQTSSMSVATASYVLNAVSSSFSALSQTANTASYAIQADSSSFATTASYAIQANSSSFAATASYVANASSFPYTGSAEITGSLIITGSALLTENITVQTLIVNNPTSTPSRFTSGSVFIQPEVQGSSLSLVQYISESVFNSAKGGNIYQGYTTNTNTGSIIISGSGNNISLTSAGSNPIAISGSQWGFQGNFNNINSLNRVTASNGAPVVFPTLNNTTINSGYTHTNFDVNRTTNGNAVLNSNFLNASLSTNVSSGSLTLTSNYIGGASSVINKSGSGSGTFSQNISLFNNSIFNLPLQSGILSSIFAGVGNTVNLNSASNSALNSSLIVGNGLIVSASYVNVGAALSSSLTLLGTFNATSSDSGQILNDNLTTVFAVGTGTISARRTSFHISSSGLTQIFNGLQVTGGITGSLEGTSSFATSASYAETASYSDNFTIGSTFTLNQTLTDYYTVESSIVGDNNLFTKATGSYTSAFIKYTITNGSNARSGEIMTVWNGTSTQYVDNSTLDIGDTSGVTFSTSIVSSEIQINATTSNSGWKIKAIGTFM